MDSQEPKAKSDSKQGEQHPEVRQSGQGPVGAKIVASKDAPQKTSKPHCPVPGCEVAAPHANDPVVKQLIHEFPSPERMIHWALTAMTELSESMYDDLTKKRAFAWHFRMRQPRELYVRTLYAVLLADEKELHHVLSGAPPNTLPFFYKKVNKIILQNRGRLLSEQGGYGGRTFTPIDHCNESAHVSFRSLWLCIDAKRKPQGIPSPEEHRVNLAAYCNSLADMHKLFKAGKTKEDVLARVIELHQLTPLFVP